MIHHFKTVTLGAFIVTLATFNAACDEAPEYGDIERDGHEAPEAAKKVEVPPAPCTAGVDPVDGVSPWIVCSASPSSAWISANSEGTYHARDICQSFGYKGVDKFGGTFGSVCGYDEIDASCTNPGSMFFDGAGLDSGTKKDPTLSFTVHWTCK